MSNGLFTNAPQVTVQDLLQQRSKRQADLQAQLMAAAGQGAKDPQKAQMFTLLGSGIGRAIAGAVGDDPQMEAAQAREAEQESLQKQWSTVMTEGTGQDKMKLGAALAAKGYAEGAELFKLGQAEVKEQQAKIAEQKRRETLVAQAEQLGLENTVDLLQGGGDLDEAAKQIRKLEEKQVIATGGRRGRIELSRNYGKTGTFIAKIQRGDYDHMSDDIFVEMLQGREADLKPFTLPDGTIGFKRIDQQGLVYEEDSGSWVNASDLGLSLAPQKVETVTQMDKITESMVDVEVENYGEVHTKATDAKNLLELNYASQAMVDQGIITGRFGQVGLEARKVLKNMGMTDSQTNELVANTEAFFKFRGRAVAEIIKAFGAGTGLSDKDREYAEGIAGGSHVLEKESINKLLELERFYANKAIKANNDIVDRLGKLAGNKWEHAESFYIKTPVIPKAPAAPAVSPALSPAAQSYLQTQ